MVDTACQGKGKFGKLGGEKSCIVNPRRACAARVTVVVLCVCMYVCMSVRTRYSGSTRS